jgi:hypothetical protein
MAAVSTNTGRNCDRECNFGGAGGSGSRERSKADLEVYISRIGERNEGRTLAWPATLASR